MQARKRGIFFCLSSPAGAGKTTISEALLCDESLGIKRVVTCTSRKQRPGEVDGVSYHFVSRAEFQCAIDAGEFFEWEEVHGNLYGVRLRDLDGWEDRLLIVDIRGALSFKRAFPDRTVLIIVVPPRPEDLKFRLLGRGTESSEQLECRLDTAKMEYQMFLTAKECIDYLIVNDILKDAVGNFKAIIQAERWSFARLDQDFLSELVDF
jgi:guanylate kinase